jgi:hypothetical protein
MENDLFCMRFVAKSKKCKGKDVGKCSAKAPKGSRGPKGNRLLSNFVMMKVADQGLNISKSLMHAKVI